MTLFWVLAAALVAGALAVLLPPLLRRRPVLAADARPAANAAVYREHLDELLADLQRGAISKEEFERASREVEHRIVAEDDGAAASAAPATPSAKRPVAVAIVVALFVPLVAGLGYWRFGEPGALDRESSRSIAPQEMEALVDRLSARLEKTPEDLEGWKLLGHSQMVLGRPELSARAWARAVQLDPTDRDSLLRMLQGLAGAGQERFEKGDFAGAIGFWERILGFVPPGSDASKAVDESLAEARAAMGKAAPGKNAQVAAGSAVRGTVRLDPKLVANSSPDDTVFIVARAIQGPRMPLAIARTTVSGLPYAYTLDDSMAMAPGVNISSQKQVVIAARISRSGKAAPEKGDIEGTSKPVAPGAKGVDVVLSRVID